MSNYWGSYVAILHSDKEHRTLVLRDCSGRIPCYYVNISGLYVFFSDIRDIEPLGLQFTLNQQYLSAYILQSQLHVRETGLTEVTELLSGDSVVITPGHVAHECAWDPREIAETSVIDSYDKAGSELAFVTDEVIRSWASVYGRILLKLSGGLDSAIVLGCLGRMGAAERVICVNNYVAGTNDDERAYARSAATATHTPLIELPRNGDAAVFVDKLYSIEPDPTPDTSKPLRMLALDAMNELAERHACRTIWTGQGGDHIFLQHRTHYPAIDYFLGHRAPYRFPRLLYESAVLSGKCVWTVLEQTFHYCRHRSAMPPDPFAFHSGASLMTPEAVDSIARGYAAGPWQCGSQRVPPGKRTQIATLADLLNRHKPLGTLEHAYQCHPLVSQPLLELSLRIPTYHLCSGGRQRALARKVFADVVPQCIIEREDKGTILDFSRDLLRGTGHLLRDELLDGTLVSLGIVDRRSVERIFAEQDSFNVGELAALFGCIAVEIWATHWRCRTPRVAA